MLKALLIDDEEMATDALQLMIARFIPSVGQVMVCNDARRAAEMIHVYEPAIVFLDIRMPYLNGFELLNNIPVKKFKVIFTTAYDEYAIKAIRFSAFDYLLKPVDAEELVGAVKRFEQENEDYSQQQALLQNIAYNFNAQGKNVLRLALPTREGVHYVLPHEIIRCEGSSNYTKFYVTDNRQFIISRTLAEFEELLAPYRFIRTHKAHLVNKAFISFYDHDGFLILKDSTKIEVSRRRKEEVLNMLKEA